MWVLQNTLSKQFFCEFAEHIPLDTRDVNEAADFEKASDAHLLLAHLHGSYEVVPKMKIVKNARQ